MEVNEQEIGKYIAGVRKKLEWLTPEDLLKRVLSLEFNRLLAYYQDMPAIDLDADPARRGERKARKARRRSGERNVKRATRTAVRPRPVMSV